MKQRGVQDGGGNTKSTDLLQSHNYNYTITTTIPFTQQYTYYFFCTGCFDRGKDLNWKGMKDLGWVAAMGKPGGGRNDVDPRFISLFTVFNMTFPNEESLFLIYNSILAGHTANFCAEIQAIVSDITKMTMELYK